MIADVSSDGNDTLKGKKNNYIIIKKNIQKSLRNNPNSSNEVEKTSYH